MEPTTATALAAPVSSAMNSVVGINNHWQIVYTVIVGVFAVIITYIWKIAKNSERLALSEKEAAASRKGEREAQINGLGTRLDAEIKRMDQIFADHLKDHEKQESLTHESIAKLEAKFAKMEYELHSIGLSIERILTILEVEDRKERVRARHEHNE